MSLASSYCNTFPGRCHIHAGHLECDAADRESQPMPRFDAKAKKGGSKEHELNSTFLHSNALNDGVVGPFFPLTKNTAPKQHQGPSRSPRRDNTLAFFPCVKLVVQANGVDDHPPSHGDQEIQLRGSQPLGLKPHNKPHNRTCQTEKRLLTAVFIMGGPF